MSYSDYKEQLQKIADINYSSALLSWDQEVHMPPKGAEIRARQLSTLAGVAHDMLTAESFGVLLNALKADTSLSKKESKNIALSLKDYTNRKKYSREFVELMSKTISQTFQAWQEAKEKNDFSIYAPQLEKLVKLKREECTILGYKEHPYDALLDQYEPEIKTSDLTMLFSDVRIQLVDFVKKIAEKPQIKGDFMFQYFDKDTQWKFGLDLLKQMGYDLEAGRQDISSHPFTINFNSHDVRVTTRVNENNLHEMIWSCIHEGGHALYEQGLDFNDYGLPSAEAISLGIHESQSRLWENNIGRSFGYWKQNFPLIQSYFPEQLKNVTVADFYKAMNLVEPSLIRTSADELTYHFHILIRFEIEKALIEGGIEVSDLPAQWNKKYKEYLGIDVPNDSHGVLQDIHWSHGSFGYFPTYSLGSFYAAQFLKQAKNEIPTLESEIENGNMKPLLDWLRIKVHGHGKYYSAEELCIMICGEKINFSHFMEYVKVKYSDLYKL